ncbi:mismatch-specific DNA-glycosylase [Bizionia myxarmorum]|uniref:Mismatch-specific DNA-glycosylase n=1 Tax=Bizionia myxarmorum TaxID=291186 RepID=A0A5D0RF45_9FLAO|nr:mismatch-specific DNA-glycosylase [Bizionia myxarmorum]TYB79174.1 mismatch-specific DNA-glycosylase [Bizionia myxarmorum]
MILQDLLQPNLDIVFCGTAVSKDSEKKGAYYAGAGNMFYPILHKIGLTPKQITPQNYTDLVHYNLGLTDLVKHTSGNDDVLNEQDFDVLEFKKKMIAYKPKMVCFNGKKAAATFFDTKTKYISYGLQPETIGETKLYVAPSTSGSARRFWDERYWRELKSVKE